MTGTYDKTFLVNPKAEGEFLMRHNVSGICDDSVLICVI